LGSSLCLPGAVQQTLSAQHTKSEEEEEDDGNVSRDPREDEATADDLFDMIE
jgi:hypothetical protein